MVKSARTRRTNSKLDPVTCRRVTALIAEYLNEELDRRTTARLEAHLRGCDDCIAFLNTYRKSVEAVRRLRFESLPVELQDRVLKVVQGQISRKTRRHP
jgi:anti-sigma factor RsiW